MSSSEDEEAKELQEKWNAAKRSASEPKSSSGSGAVPEVKTETEEEEVEEIQISDEQTEDSINSLYASYFFAAWGDRMWEFAAILFLLDIFPSTLLPSSLFGFFESLAGILGGPRVGAYIDQNDRLKVIQTSILGQNSVIYVASIVFHLALKRVDEPGGLSYEVKMLTTLIIIIAGMAAKLTSSMNKISIHKDWVVVVAGKCDKRRTRINSGMRRVDLVTSILAPMLVGVLSGVIGSAATCLVIAAWSACSLVLEVWLSQWVYGKDRRLQVKPKKEETEETQAAVPPQPKSPSNKVNAASAAPKTFFGRMYLYQRHRAFGVSLPYCFLYMSVLSFHGTIVAYLRTAGTPDAWLAAGRGLAALVAIVATYAVPSMNAKLGLLKTGSITLWSQIACLAPLVVLFVMYPTFEQQQNTYFIAGVFITICASRFGLWGFDLAQVQMMQDLVEHSQAGVINGAQDTVVNICWLMSYVFTVVFNDPKQFLYPVLLSFGSILTAALLFSSYASNHIEADLTNWKKSPLSGRSSTNRAPSPKRALPDKETSGEKDASHEV